MADKLNIKNWALEDRPREKLLERGADALSEAELLAILIGSGNTEESAVDLMRRVLSDCGNSLKTLGRMTVSNLVERYKGMGPAKAITILAACELGRRRQHEDAVSKKKVTTAKDIYEFFVPILQDKSIEECHVLLLNQNHRILDSRMISRGGIAGASVDVREVLRHALLAQAPVIALCHNHPSGNVLPSTDDDRLTLSLNNAARTMNIRLLDHVVVTDGNYYSYVEHAKL